MSAHRLTQNTQADVIQRSSGPPLARTDRRVQDLVEGRLDRAHRLRRRREFCHSATPPSPFSRRFDRDGEGASDEDEGEEGEQEEEQQEQEQEEQEEQEEEEQEEQEEEEEERSTSPPPPSR